jgi:hypothetical protein
MARHLIPSDTTIRTIKPGDSRKRLSDGDGLVLLEQPVVIEKRSSRTWGCRTAHRRAQPSAVNRCKLLDDSDPDVSSGPRRRGSIL